MKTWDDIKRETEKGARKLWADDEHDDGLEPECKHEPEHILQTCNSDTLCHSPYSPNLQFGGMRENSGEYSDALSKPAYTRTRPSESEYKNDTVYQSEYKKSYSEAVSTLVSHSDTECLSTAYLENTHSDKPALGNGVSEYTVPGHVFSQPDSHTKCASGRIVSESYLDSPSDSPSQMESVPGDPIGIRSIQSIMMSATQMNLSHFHTAGMSSSLGQLRVPSAAEAMNSTYTKNNTSMKFTMHSEKNTFEQLRYLRKQLVGASLGNFVRRIGSNLTGLNDRENIWYSTLSGESLFPNGSISTEDPRVLLRFYIDFNKMHNHGLTLENLAQEVFGSDCQWNVSPDFMGMIDILVPPDTYISQWLSRTKNRVCGTSYVLSCDSLGKQRVFTRGTNVLAACKVPGVDKSTLTLNNVISVEKNFGIEAAANILAELTGNDSDTRVFSPGRIVISDFMARTGTVLPFSKHSNEVSSKGLLTSMGFERPKDDIQREITGKVIKSKSRHMKSVYEHIITGKDAPSSFKILT